MHNTNIDTPEGMAAAVEWQTNLVNRLAQGDRWVVPRSGTSYTIDHEGRQVERLHGRVPEPTITRVFFAMGWKVYDGRRRTRHHPGAQQFVLF